MFDLASTIGAQVAITPRVVTDNTAAVGEVIDTAGFHILAFVIATGTLADADATFAVLVEHGDEAGGGDMAAAPDGDLIGTEAEAGFTFAADAETRKIGYIGGKRNVRLTVTPSGNSGNAPIAAVAILGHAGERPVA